MSLTDFFIVYLACGAPFGAYYFLHNRTITHSSRLWFNALLSFIFWFPFAVYLIGQSEIFATVFKENFNTALRLKAKNQNNIFIIQKEFEKILLENRPPISLFELRETFERYVGLTLANQTDAAEISEHEREIFRVAQRGKISCAALCLHRRNQKRLALHQTAARRDFLHLIKLLFDSSSERSELENSSIELVKILKDSAAQSSFEKMFAARLQTNNLRSVEQMEKDLWKPQIHKPLSARTILTDLPTMAAVNSRRKD